MAEPVVDIKIDEAQMARIRHMIAGFPKALPRILVGSVNRIARTVRGDLTKTIAKDVALPQKSIRRRIRLRRATRQRMAAGLYLDDKPLSLHLFKPRQTALGVTYKIAKNESRQLLPHGFIQTINRLPFVLKRIAPGDDPAGQVQKHGGQSPLVPRYPIDIQRGPALRELFTRDPAIASRLRAEANANLLVAVDRQIKQYLWARQKFGVQP